MSTEDVNSIPRSASCKSIAMRNARKRNRRGRSYAIVCKKSFVMFAACHLSLVTTFRPDSINRSRRGLCINSWVTSRSFSTRRSENLEDTLRTLLDNNLLDKASRLPIFDILYDVCHSLSTKPNLLLEAPPGAGKTSMVPLALLNELLKWKMDQPVSINIIVVQPRRVAARSAASRMASLLNEPVGKTVGYAIRGESRISKNTKVTVLTDGVLLNKLRQDPELSGVDAVIFDEFHERGVDSDTALCLCRESQNLLRPDLRLIVMSATLLGEYTINDIENGNNAAFKLVQVLGGSDNCTVLQSDGRQYPIECLYANQFDWKISPTTRYQPLSVIMKDRNMLAKIMCAAIEQGVARAPVSGDVLAFLPGVAEIRLVTRLLQDQSRPLLKDVEILPLYGALPKDQQDYVLFTSDHSPRRIIVATPIAEASLTLERVTCVVDSGLRRELRCDVDTGMPRLVTVRCSKASATQRAGRAGRVQEGLCLRIYNQAEFEDQFLEHDLPEIASCDLAPIALLLADWGCLSVKEMLEDLPFVDPPDQGALEKAIQLLVELRALEWHRVDSDDRLSITPFGQDIAKLPTHPRFATCIARACDNPVQLAASVAVAFLLDDEIGVRDGINDPDLIPRVQNIYQSSTSRALVRYAARFSNSAKQAVQDVVDRKISLVNVVQAVGSALLPGFVDMIAERKSDASYGGSSYMLSLGRSARLDGTSNIPDYAVVVETSTSDDGKARIRSFAPVDKDILLEKAEEREEVFTVPSCGHEVRARKILEVGSLELASTPLPAPSSEQVAKALKDTIRDLGGVYTALFQTLSPNKKQLLHELCSRVRLTTKLANESLTWPACFAAWDAQASGLATNEDADVLEELIDPWLAAAGSIKKLDIYEILLGSLTPDQQRQLDSEYPVEILAPDGSKIPVRYSTGTPTASAKLQQFFGTMESPAVGPANKRVSVTLSLLSPSGKVLAQTVDLPFFWKQTYPSVRAEMRGRYAKHPWPEDPLTATATRQTKKQQAVLNAKNDGTSSDASRSKKKQRGRKR